MTVLPELRRLVRETIGVAMLRVLPLILLLALLLALTPACSRFASPTVFLDPALVALVPADTVALAGVRMQQLADTPFWKRYVATGRMGPLEKFKQETGLDPAKDLWEFLIASDAKNVVVLIRGKFSEHGFEPRLERPGAQRFAYKGYTMIGNEDGAVVFLNPSTAAAGSAPVLRRLIDNRNNITGLPKPLEERVKKISSKNQAWFVAQIGGKVPVQAPGNFGPLIQSIQYATGAVDVREKLRANISLECGSENDAERLRTTVAGLLGMGRLSTPEERGDSRQMFDNMQVVRERALVRFSTDLGFEELESSPLLRPLFGVK